MKLIGAIRQDIRCVFERDPAARSLVEIATLYPGVHALIWYRIANRLWLRNWRYGARFLSWFARFLTNIDIHPGATIGERFFIDHGAGEWSLARRRTLAMASLFITVSPSAAPPGTRASAIRPLRTMLWSARVPRSWGAVRIGCNSKVGANSVVVRNVPSGATVVGVPGSIVRSKDKIAYLDPHGIDLNHHLIPDPVSDAIACLVKRVELLEAELRGQHEDEGDCDACDAASVCEHDDGNLREVVNA